MRKLFNDEAGFVVSAELILVMTIAVLGMVVGLGSIRDAVTSELIDLSNAFGAIDQTVNIQGNLKVKSGTVHRHHGSVAGWGYNDAVDDCDCKEISFTDVCGKKAASATGEND